MGCRWVRTVDRGLINTADDQAGYGGFAVRSYVREGIKQRSNLGGGFRRCG